MNDNTQLFMIRAKLETLKITLQEEPLTSIVQNIQDDITELINENSITDELNNPVKPIDDEQDRKKEITECLIKLTNDDKELLKELDKFLTSWINSKGLNKSETPSKENTDKTEKIKEWMDTIIKDMNYTYEPYNDNIIDSTTTKTESRYLKDLFKDYRY